jgi:hypothetical protein
MRAIIANRGYLSKRKGTPTRAPLLLVAKHSHDRSTFRVASVCADASRLLSLLRLGRGGRGLALDLEWRWSG